MTKVYCDTCVYRDAFEGRKAKYRDLDDFAWDFFNRVSNGEFVLVTSDWVFEEFKKTVGDDSKLVELISSLEESQKIHVTKEKEDVKAAKELSPANWQDALHVILAKKADAFILTTRNIKDFVDFEHLIKISLPEHL